MYPIDYLLSFSGPRFGSLCPVDIDRPGALAARCQIFPETESHFVFFERGFELRRHVNHVLRNRIEDQRHNISQFLPDSLKDVGGEMS